MVELSALWLPILVSSVVVFVASSLVWMVLPHHRSDWKGLPGEAGILESLRSAAPGQYRFPFPPDRNAMKTPEFQKKMAEGPMGTLIVMPRGAFNMGKLLGIWFVYLLIVSTCVAYMAGHALPRGAMIRPIIRVTGGTAILAYVSALVPASIWGGRPWVLTIKDVIDGIVYGLLTAAVFCWLWPA